MLLCCAIRKIISFFFYRIKVKYVSQSVYSTRLRIIKTIIFGRRVSESVYIYRKQF